MKTKTINVYSFTELSADAKRRAKDRYASVFGYSFADEAFESLKALAVHFGGKLKDYDVEFFASSHSSAEFEMPNEDDMPAREIEARLSKLGTFDADTLKGHGDCVLTGVCTDESAIDGFRKAWHCGERDLDRLMEAAFRSWLADCQADCAAFYEDEQFAEHAEANGYEYLENGDMSR